VKNHCELLQVGRILTPIGNSTNILFLLQLLDSCSMQFRISEVKIALLVGSVHAHVND